MPRLALFSISIIAAIVCLLVLNSLLLEPTLSEQRRSSQEYQGAQEYEEQTAPPSVFALFSSRGVRAYADYCANEPANKPDKWLHKFTCDVRASDAYVAAFTALLAFITGGLIFVGAKQEIHLRDTARRELRAYVCVEDVFFDWQKRDDPSSGYTDKLRLRFKNYGKTPATLASVRWKRAHNFNADDTEPLRDFGQMILPPGARFGRPLGEEAEFPHDKDRDCFVYGRFTYRDIYEQWHTVRFSYVHHWDGAISVFTPYCDYNRETGHKSKEEAVSAV